MENKNREYIPYNSENSDGIQYDIRKNKVQYSSIKRKELLAWMAMMPENVLCEVMKDINPSPFKKTMSRDMARLHALLVAADRVRSALERTDRKNPDRDLAALEESHNLHLALIARPKTRRSPKREKVALHEGVIRQLFVKGYSLRQVCLYLKRYASLDVNHSYLRQCCLELGIALPRTRQEASFKNAGPGNE